MSEIFKHLFDFVFVKTKRNSIRLLRLIIIVSAILLVNDYFGISRNIRVNQKLAQLDKLKALDPAGFQNDPLLINEIQLVKISILDKSSFLEKSKLFLSNQIDSMLNWRSLTASFSFLIAMLIIPIFVFSDKSDSLPKRFLIVIIMELIFLTVSIVFIKVLGLIPDFKYIWINHALNWLIQIVFLLPFSIAAGKRKSKEIEN